MHPLGLIRFDDTRRFGASLSIHSVPNYSVLSPDPKESTPERLVEVEENEPKRRRKNSLDSNSVF